MTNKQRIKICDLNAELSNLKTEIIQLKTNDIQHLKVDLQWVKKIGYYLSGIITLQLVATLTGKI